MTNQYTRGISILGLIVLLALAAGIVWSILSLINQPLEHSPKKMVSVAASSEVQLPNPPELDMFASSTPVVATTTATSTKATTTPAKKP